MVVKTEGTQKESKQVVSIAPKKLELHFSTDYDNFQPEEKLRNFVRDMKEMVARFEADKARIIEIENELEDIFHFIELSTTRRAPDGYKLYKKIADLRRERRCCKNEVELLQPVYEHFHATEVLNKLSKVQGACGIVKKTIDARVYGVRTDILDEFMDDKKYCMYKTKDAHDVVMTKWEEAAQEGKAL